MNVEELFQQVRNDDYVQFTESIGKIDINSVNCEGQNLLHESISYSRQRFAEHVVNLGVDVNHVDNRGMTPLHYCAVYGDFLLAKKLLSHGGDLSIADNYGNQPLWTAVFNARGYYDLVHLYVDNRADINHVNSAGKSPLSFAEQICDKELIDILKSRGSSEFCVS